MDDSFATSGQDGATRVPFINSRPLTCWTEDNLDIEICIAPVLVCSQVQDGKMARRSKHKKNLFSNSPRLFKLLEVVTTSQPPA